MEFRLTYEGPLKASAGVPDKQALRRCFHNQLRVLWDQVPLNDCKDLLNPSPSTGGVSILRPVGPFIVAPLVCERIHLVADLDITMLRPEPPGRVTTQSGDIDNRLKTLFDSLRMPTNSSELPADDQPGPSETLFYCLLEDDNLITKVSVVTDRLLRSVSSPNDVLLVIRVTTRVTRQIWKNIGLG